MYDFEVATGITPENVEEIARDRDWAKMAAVCGCGAPAGDHPSICEGCYQQEMCEEPL